MATAHAARPIPKHVVTPVEAESFRDLGFVLPAQGLDAGTTAAMVAAMEEVFAANPDWHNLVRMPHIPLRPGVLEG